ncbi:MAG TPA: MFS transporter [Steroidobacteraceae bacterium]|nr:MFS transporter [Steroidobacteraceae bacterium]
MTQSAAHSRLPPISGGERGTPLTLRLKLGYAAGQLIDGIVNNTLSVFLLFYVTAVCGLSGALAGAALSAGIIVDAVADPVIGAWSDGLHSRFGRRLPFMLGGLIPIATTFVLIFTLPSGLSQGALFAWVAALSIILRVSTSLFILPYQAVGAELSDDYHERSSIMAWRWGMGMSGAALAVTLGFGVFLTGHDGLSRRAAYGPFAIVLAGIFLIGGLIAARATHGVRQRLHAPTENIGWLGARVLHGVREALRNHSFRILFVGALLFFIALGTNSSLALHANTFFWHLTGAKTQIVTLALFVGLLAGAPLAGPCLVRLEKATVLMIGMGGLLVAQGAPVLLRLLHLFPWSGATLAWLLAGIMFVGGALMATAAIAFSSMMADAADEHEHLFGQRREGLFFAAWAFASKASTGAGALIAGALLQMIHFPTNLAERGGTSAPLPESMTDWLGLLYGPGAALLTLAAVLTTLFYRLDSKAHAVIIGELEERRRVAIGSPVGCVAAQP